MSNSLKRQWRFIGHSLAAIRLSTRNAAAARDTYSVTVNGKSVVQQKHSKKQDVKHG